MELDIICVIVNFFYNPWHIEYKENDIVLWIVETVPEGSKKGSKIIQSCRVEVWNSGVTFIVIYGVVLWAIYSGGMDRY